MSQKKILSIIIPVYNADMYLEECLNSILVSSEKKYEIILINDGSTDNSKTICEKYVSKNNNVYLYNQENKGVSSARNFGVMMSKAKYIMFVDADDILKNGWDQILKYLNNDDIYYFSQKIASSASKNELLSYIIGNNSKNICFAGPFSKLFKKSYLQDKDIKFREGLINGEDMLYNVNCLLNAEKYTVINYSFYLYRNFIGSATKKFNDKIFDSDLSFQKEISRLLSSDKLLSDETIEKALLYCRQMAIFVFCQRISFIDTYKKAKKQYFKIFNDLYCDALKKEIVINKKYILFIYLCKYRMFYINYYIMKLKNKIKISKKKAFYFSEI